MGKAKKGSHGKKSNSPLVVNSNKSNKNKSNLSNSVSGDSKNNKPQKITITIDEEGTTLNLKRFEDGYICTECLQDLNINTNKTSENAKKPTLLQCAVCLKGEYKKDDQSSSSNGKKKRSGGNDTGVIERYNEKMSNGIKGLQNLGNTCFFNSIMQNLTHIPLLRDAFLKKEPGHDGIIHTTSSMTMEMYYYFMKMYRSNASIVSPSGLFTEIVKKSPRFRGFKQQDSHELLRYLLDGLISEEQTTTKNRKDPTYLDRIFGGQLISIITCFHCGYVSKTFEPFLDLSLPIPTQADISLKKLQQRLQEKQQEQENMASTTTTTTTTTVEVERDQNGKRISKHQKKKLLQKQKLDDEFETSNITPILDGADSNINTNSNIDKIIIISDVEDEGADDNKDGEIDKKILVSNIVINETYTDDNSNNSNNNNKSCSMESSVIEFTTPNTNSMPVIFDNYENMEYQPIIVSPMVIDKQPLSALNTDDSLKNGVSDLESSFEKISIDSSFPNTKGINSSSNDVDKNSLVVENNLSKKLEQQKQENENDIQKVPVDLRQNLPTDAYNIGSLLSCLLQFTNPEKLEGENGFICTNCTKIHKEKKELEKLNNTTLSSTETSPIIEQQEQQEKEQKSSSPTIITIDDEEDIIKSTPISPSFTQISVLEIKSKTIDVDNPIAEPVTTITEQIKEEKIEEISIEDIPLFSKDEDSNGSLLTPELFNNNGADSGNNSTPVVTGASTTPAIITPQEPLSKSAKKKLRRAQKEKELEEMASAPVVSSKSSTITKKKQHQEEDDYIRRNASKQYLLSHTPPFITIQLKRFMQTRLGFIKNSKHIDFPITLDLTPFTDQTTTPTTNGDNTKEDEESSTSDILKSNHKYKLNGIVEHMGGMNGGHYVAYVYDDMDDQWYYISDSHVKLTSLHSLLTNEAYILFYRKDGIEDELFDEIFSKKNKSNLQPVIVDKEQNPQEQIQESQEILPVEQKEVKEVIDKIIDTTNTTETSEEINKE